MKFTAILVIICWLILGLYFGIGGLSRAKLDDTLIDIEKDKISLKKDSINVTYDGLTFTNNYELKYALEAESIEKVFPWAIKVSSFVSLIITSFSFGLIGGVISLIKQVAFDGLPLEDLKIWSIPLLGFLTGLVVFGITFLVPTLIVKNASEIRPMTIMFLCLFAGMYSKSFYKKITNYFNKMFL